MIDEKQINFNLGKDICLAQIGQLYYRLNHAITLLGYTQEARNNNLNTIGVSTIEDIEKEIEETALKIYYSLTGKKYR